MIIPSNACLLRSGYSREINILLVAQDKLSNWNGDSIRSYTDREPGVVPAQSTVESFYLMNMGGKALPSPIDRQRQPLSERPLNDDISLKYRFSYLLVFGSATASGRSNKKPHIIRIPPSLSREERKRRQGIPPLDRLVAIHDEVPYNISPSQAGKLLGSVPVRRQLG